jgi:predicted branched-subunit amino acid permease
MTSTGLEPAAVRAPVAATGDLAALGAGARAMLPFLAGVAPLGLAIGVTVAASDLPRLAGWSLSWLVYAGSAQLAAVGLLAGSAPVAAVVVTVAVINLRLALYSAALAPQWRGTPRWWQLLAAYLVVDPSFAVASQSYDGSRSRRAGHLHYLGGAAVLWVGCLAVTAVGVTAGAVLPLWLRLGAVGQLYLVSIVVGHARTPGTLPPVLVAGTVAALAVTLPLHLGLVVGIAAGLLVGVRRRRS